MIELFVHLLRFFPSNIDNRLKSRTNFFFWDDPNFVQIWTESSRQCLYNLTRYWYWNRFSMFNSINCAFYSDFPDALELSYESICVAPNLKINAENSKSVFPGKFGIVFNSLFQWNWKLRGKCNAFISISKKHVFSCIWDGKRKQKCQYKMKNETHFQDTGISN